jgi:hypothetical protein
VSERAARKWQSGPLPSTAKAPQWWRTREEPFAEVWQSEVVPQLVADTDGRLLALTVFKALCGRHPGRFQPGQLRTLQRRVREWRVQYGPDREVYFEQVPVPGREAAFDFGPAGLWTLGAVPAVLRHYNLSAATHELRRSGGRRLTARFRQVFATARIWSNSNLAPTTRCCGGRGHRPTDILGVCSPPSRRVAALPPRLRGAAWTTASRTLVQTGSDRTMPNLDPLHVVVDDPSRIRQ